MRGSPPGSLTSGDSLHTDFVTSRTPAHAQEKHKPRPVLDTGTLRDSPRGKGWGGRVEGPPYGREDSQPCRPGVYPLPAEPQPGLELPEATAEPLASFSNGAAAAGAIRRDRKKASSGVEGAGPREYEGPCPPPEESSLPAHGAAGDAGGSAEERTCFLGISRLPVTGRDGGSVDCGGTRPPSPCHQTRTVRLRTRPSQHPGPRVRSHGDPERPWPCPRLIT